MSYKCLRILIAEEQNVLRLRIEKSLGELGYRAFTNAHSLRELLALTHYSSDPFEQFDLMIINGELMVAAGIDPVRFFQSNPQIRHGVIHDARRGQPQAEIIYATYRRQLSLVQTADRQTLSTLLEQLDA
jgi:CheY-like chemotaxis protein